MTKPTQECILFHNAFLFSSDAIVLTDLHGVITEVNKAFCELFGYSREELIGQTTRIIRSQHTDDLFYQKMWESIQEAGEWKGEIINQDKSGNPVSVLLSITPILQDGQKIGYMGIEIDMREQIKIQENMARSERLATIGKMAAKVAHEIRNPLSSISLNAEILQDELKSENFSVEEAQSLLSSIMREVDRLANLTNEYLQFSRMPKSQNEAHNICRLIENLTIFIESELRANQIELKMNLPEQPVLVKMDKDQIHRVLLNLVRNSIEALSQGGTININLENHKSYLEILLSDTGNGISADQLDKVFEPFYTTKDIGTGLGLPISKQIIEEHGGTIAYLTDKAPGANFLITLPLNGYNKGH
ncbi:MAG: PAS domain S-box protein [Calditrichae bacterium]|nr:PAS domain S-box protein [Calditrichota bacterium]MCB9057584.1 PAS domain S-box protein [Calditrichia bacterium]